PLPVSRHAARLFARIRDIIKDGFADPDFGPREVAAETGISLRYLQKLFTVRGSTCSDFIYSLRLDHAARLLHRRASLGTSQPLNEIAYLSGWLRSEEHTSELQSLTNLVCRLLLEKKKYKSNNRCTTMVCKNI